MQKAFFTITFITASLIAIAQAAASKKSFDHTQDDLSSQKDLWIDEGKNCAAKDAARVAEYFLKAIRTAERNKSQGLLGKVS